MTRAYSYERCSKQEQAKGDSIRRQSTNATEICRAKGWTLDNSIFLRDEGMRAFDGSNHKLGKLAAFLDEVKAKRIRSGSVLIIEDIDRLSREDIPDALPLFMSIVNAGITIYVVRTEREYSRDTLKSQPFLIMEAIMAMILAHDESEKKSKRSNAWWEDRRCKAQDKRQPITPTCPAWLELQGEKIVRNGRMRTKLEGSKFEKIPSAVATIKRIFKRIIDGDGLTTLTEWLRKEKIPLIVPQGKKRGHQWCRSTIHYLLKNRELLGEFQPHVRENRKRKPIGKPIQGYYPEIIDLETFNKVQTILKARKVQTGPKKNKGVNLFSGLLRMNERPMHLVSSLDKAKGRTWYYLASAAREHGEKIGGRVRYDVFESGVLSWLREITPNDLATDENAKTEITDLEAAIQAHQLKIDAIVHDKNAKDFASILALLKRLETEQTKLAAQLESARSRLKAQSPDTLLQTQKLIGLASGEHRQKLRTRIAELIQSIEVRIEGEWQTKRIYCKLMFRSGTERRIYFTTDGERGLWPSEKSRIQLEDLEALLAEKKQPIEVVTRDGGVIVK